MAARACSHWPRRRWLASSWPTSPAASCPAALSVAARPRRNQKSGAEAAGSASVGMCEEVGERERKGKLMNGRNGR